MNPLSYIERGAQSGLSKSQQEFLEKALNEQSDIDKYILDQVFEYKDGKAVGFKGGFEEGFKRSVEIQVGLLLSKQPAVTRPPTREGIDEGVEGWQEDEDVENTYDYTGDSISPTGEFIARRRGLTAPVLGGMKPPAYSIETSENALQLWYQQIYSDRNYLSILELNPSLGLKDKDLSEIGNLLSAYKKSGTKIEQDDSSLRLLVGGGTIFKNSSLVNMTNNSDTITLTSWQTALRNALKALKDNWTGATEPLRENNAIAFPIKMPGDKNGDAGRAIAEFLLERVAESVEAASKNSKQNKLIAPVVWSVYKADSQQGNADPHLETYVLTAWRYVVVNGRGTYVPMLFPAKLSNKEDSVANLVVMIPLVYNKKTGTGTLNSFASGMGIATNRSRQPINIAREIAKTLNEGYYLPLPLVFGDT